MIKKTCIDLISELGESFKENKSSKELFIGDKPELKRIWINLEKILPLSRTQTIFFSSIFYLHTQDHDLTIKDIAKQLKVPLKSYPEMYKVLEELIEIGFLFKNEIYMGRFEYIPGPLIKDAIFKGEAPQQESYKTDNTGLLLKIDNCEENLNYRRINVSQAASYYKKLASQNEEIKICNLILRSHFKDEDIILIMNLYNSFYNRVFSINYNEVINDLFRNAKEKTIAKRNIFNKSSSLFKNKIIKFDGEDYENRDYILLTKKAKELIFEDEELQSIVEVANQHDRVIEPERIERKKLYFNLEEGSEIKKILKILDQKQFIKIQSTLKERGLSNGICILLYGPAGTGKTETVFQIARLTKRAIKKVELSSIKDKYVGESEKKLKTLFNNYNNMVNKRTTTPILLLNEADGLIGKRISVNSSVDQMNNTLQNILLEELETFNGILIATTNLEMNLDNAFDRRFLFKIKLKKPAMSTREKIITSKIPFLIKEDARQVAAKYELTGGQLNNVERKITLHQILYQKEPDVNDVLNYCEQEVSIRLTENKGQAIIGFKINRNPIK